MFVLQIRAQLDFEETAVRSFEKINFTHFLCVARHALIPKPKFV